MKSIYFPIYQTEPFISNILLNQFKILSDLNFKAN